MSYAQADWKTSMSQLHDEDLPTGKMKALLKRTVSKVINPIKGLTYMTAKII